MTSISGIVTEPRSCLGRVVPAAENISDQTNADTFTELSVMHPIQRWFVDTKEFEDGVGPLLKVPRGEKKLHGEPLSRFWQIFNRETTVIPHKMGAFKEWLKGSLNERGIAFDEKFIDQAVFPPFSFSRVEFLQIAQNALNADLFVSSNLLFPSIDERQCHQYSGVKTYIVPRDKEERVERKGAILAGFKNLLWDFLKEKITSNLQEFCGFFIPSEVDTHHLAYNLIEDYDTEDKKTFFDHFLTEERQRNSSIKLNLPSSDEDDNEKGYHVRYSFDFSSKSCDDTSFEVVMCSINHLTVEPVCIQLPSCEVQNEPLPLIFFYRHKTIETENKVLIDLASRQCPSSDTLSSFEKILKVSNAYFFKQADVQINQEIFKDFLEKFQSISHPLLYDPFFCLVFSWNCYVLIDRQELSVARKETIIEWMKIQLWTVAEAHERQYTVADKSLEKAISALFFSLKRVSYQDFFLLQRNYTWYGCFSLGPLHEIDPIEEWFSLSDDEQKFFLERFCKAFKLTEDQLMPLKKIQPFIIAHELIVPNAEKLLPFLKTCNLSNEAIHLNKWFLSLNQNLEHCQEFILAIICNPSLRKANGALTLLQNLIRKHQRYLSGIDWRKILDEQKQNRAPPFNLAEILASAYALLTPVKTYLESFNFDQLKGNEIEHYYKAVKQLCHTSLAYADCPAAISSEDHKTKDEIKRCYETVLQFADKIVPKKNRQGMDWFKELITSFSLSYSKHLLSRNFTLGIGSSFINLIWEKDQLCHQPIIKSKQLFIDLFLDQIIETMKKKVGGQKINKEIWGLLSEIRSKYLLNLDYISEYEKGILTIYGFLKGLDKNNSYLFKDLDLIGNCQLSLDNQKEVDAFVVKTAILINAHKNGADKQADSTLASLKPLAAVLELVVLFHDTCKDNMPQTLPLLSQQFNEIERTLLHEACLNYFTSKETRMKQYSEDLFRIAKEGQDILDQGNGIEENQALACQQLRNNVSYVTTLLDKNIWFLQDRDFMRLQHSFIQVAFLVRGYQRMVLGEEALIFMNFFRGYQDQPLSALIDDLQAIFNSYINGINHSKNKNFTLNLFYVAFLLLNSFFTLFKNDLPLFKQASEALFITLAKSWNELMFNFEGSNQLEISDLDREISQSLYAFLPDDDSAFLDRDGSWFAMIKMLKEVEQYMRNSEKYRNEINAVLFDEVQAQIRHYIHGIIEVKEWELEEMCQEVMSLFHGL